MEVFEVITQSSRVGYPLVVWYLIAVIGVVLLICRPYWAWLFSLFCFAARDYYAAVYTRTPFLNVYCNLNDLMLWIAFFSMVMTVLRAKEQGYAPKLLLAIFALVLFGDLQSISKYGFIKEVLRRIWSTAIFPILFLVGANMVQDVKRARCFYWTLFFGGVVASLQHMYFIHNITSYDIYAGIGEIRNISYSYSGGVFLLIDLIFRKKDKKMSPLRVSFYYIGMAFIGLSYVLTFTRGFYIVFTALLLVVPVLIWKHLDIPKNMVRVTVVVTFALCFVGTVFPDVNFGSILNERFEGLINKQSFSTSYETRWLGAQTELSCWKNSLLIIGVGSSLPPEIESAGSTITGALYHVGFATYLAHFGLLGLTIYGILVPFLTIKIARQYYTEHLADYGGNIALIAIACALSDFLSLSASHSHVGPHSHILGLIYGAMWGLNRRRCLEADRRPHRTIISSTSDV